MTMKLKRQIVDKIYKLHNTPLLKIIAGLLGIKMGVQHNELSNITKKSIQ